MMRFVPYHNLRGIRTEVCQVPRPDVCQVVVEWVNRVPSHMK